MNPPAPTRRGLLLAAPALLLAPPAPAAVSPHEPLRIGFTNTREAAALPLFGPGGVRDAQSLDRLDLMMRDWRENVAVRMDRRLYDFLYVLQRVVGAMGGTGGILVVSGFRTPRTNAMLRGRSEGVALNSFHTRGMAVDFRVVGMSCLHAARIAWTLNMGGVGLYGEDFVHVDTGPRRRWGDPF